MQGRESQEEDGNKRAMAKFNAKQKAWDALAKYIRVKECLETTGFPFLGVCFTCDRQFHINALDAGHYVSGRRNAVLFKEQGVHIQCKWWCNRMKHSNHDKYKAHLIEYYATEEDPKAGEKVVERLEALKHKVILNRDMDFEGIEKRYKQKLKELKAN